MSVSYTHLRAHETLANLTFKPETEQAAVAEDIAKELSELRQYIIDNREEMAQARKENGIEGKY